MKRNKYSKEFQEEMIKLATTNELEKLLSVATKKYKYPITKEQLRQYLSKRGIRYKDYNKHKAHDMGKILPIGTEYVKSDGMVLVKVSNKKWEYKQRLIYEKYHNVKLNSDDFIIFLDQNRKNFDINNLKRISRKESSILINKKMFSKNPKITETGILTAKLMAKTKQCEEDLKKYPRGNNMSKSTIYYYKRHKTGLTRSEVANYLEVDYDRYMLWEQGVLEMPSKYIDKFNELIHRKKGEHQIERLNHEKEVNEWWEEMRQKDEKGNYKLNEVAKQYNFKTTRELSEKLGFGRNSVSFFLSHGKVSYDKKDRMYTFLHDELNIQPPKKQENTQRVINRGTKTPARGELLNWYRNINLKQWILNNGLSVKKFAELCGVSPTGMFYIVNPPYPTYNPTEKNLTKIKNYIDESEGKNVIKTEEDSTTMDIPIIDDKVEENIMEEPKELQENFIEETKPIIQPLEEKTEDLLQVQKAIGRVEVLLAKAKADVLIYEDILKDLKGE